MQTVKGSSMQCDNSSTAACPFLWNEITLKKRNNFHSSHHVSAQQMHQHGTSIHMPKMWHFMFLLLMLLFLGFYIKNNNDDGVADSIENIKKRKQKKKVVAYVVQIMADVCARVASICIECTRVFIFIKSLPLQQLCCSARAWSPWKHQQIQNPRQRWHSYHHYVYTNTYTQTISRSHSNKHSNIYEV